MNVEEDEAGRLAGFRARFGGGFDVQKGEVEEVTKERKGKKGDVKAEGKEQIEVEGRKVEGQEVGRETRRERQKKILEDEEADESWDFGEEDENMLDLISRFGQDEDIRQKDAPALKKKE